MSLSKIMNAVSDHIHTYSDKYVAGSIAGGMALIATAGYLVTTPPENGAAMQDRPTASADAGTSITRNDPLNYFEDQQSIVNTGKRGSNPNAMPNLSISPGNMYPESGFGSFSFN